MKIRKTLRKSLLEHFPVRLFTASETLDCVVVNLSDKLMIVNAITDFEFDGYIAIETDSVTEVRCDIHEQLELRILNNNNELLKHMTNDIPVSSSLHDLVTYFLGSSIWPAFTVREKKHDAFYVGPIIAVEDECFALKAYDDVGNWEDTYKLRFIDVRKVIWNNRYLRNFNNYMRQQ